MTDLAPWMALLLALATGLVGLIIGRRLQPPPPKIELPPPPPPSPRNIISIEALFDPALIVEGFIAVAANLGARQLFGDRVADSDLRLTLRHPLVLDAIAEARLPEGQAQREIVGLGNGSGAWMVYAVNAGNAGIAGGAGGAGVAGGAVDTSGGRVLVLFDDITQARMTERMRVDFVANASHELRTPLATLSGFIETLQGPAAEDEPARRRFLDIMHHEAERMSRLIDDLLSLSRIEIDKHVRPASLLDLRGIVSEVGKTLAMRLDADQRRLEIHESRELPVVVADRDQVLQVLHNLISNALKYGRPGTPITVFVGPEPAAVNQPASVRMSVVDIGEGISAQHLPRLTERFYRVDSQRSRKMGGTGLGLAIVKHIVERHRGRLEIESRPGEGTRVSVLLPQAPAASGIVSYVTGTALPSRGDPATGPGASPVASPTASPNAIPNSGVTELQQ